MELQQATMPNAPVNCICGTELEQARDFIYQTAGVLYPEKFSPLLLDSCQHRMSKLGQTSLAEYVQYLTTAPGRLAELKELLDEIALGGTCFYENAAQLEALAGVVLPEIKKKSNGCAVRIWSAGCSTGEDPYSIAMFLMEHGDEVLQKHGFEIIATHPHRQTLENCEQGIYGHYALRNLSESLLARYFHPTKEGLFQVNDCVKEKIKFQNTNLLDDSRMVFLKSMDVIFCRNVLKSFSLESKLHVLRHFHHNLYPHGYLFLGDAETLFGVTDSFKLIHFTGATGYTKKPANT